jgi:acetyl-CoA carboxylase biotin carboxyl carrier protein
MGNIPVRDIDALLELFDRSTWREMHLVGPGVDLFISKDPNARRKSRDGAASIDVAMAEPAMAVPATPHIPAASAPILAEPVPAHWIAVRAPCLGTFYSAPKSGAPPFVKVGQHVEVNTELCLVEVMKLFTSIRSSVAGTVRKMLAADASLVEFDQPLLYLEPDAQ